MHLSRLITLSVAVLCLNACQSAQPALIFVDATGDSTEADAYSLAPAEELRKLAATGINTAILLGPVVMEMSTLISQFYDVQAVHRANYRLRTLPDWSFQNSMYSRTTADGAISLKAQFTDASGKPAAWDITDPANFTPPIQAEFPSSISQVRLSAERTLPEGGHLAVTFFAPLVTQDRSAAITASGSGSATVRINQGTIGIEALTAVFSPGHSLDNGLLGLKYVVSGSGVFQFSARYTSNGLSGPASLLKNGKSVGEVQLSDGHWQIKNGAGVFPL